MTADSEKLFQEWAVNFCKHIGMDESEVAIFQDDPLMLAAWMHQQKEIDQLKDKLKSALILINEIQYLIDFPMMGRNRSILTKEKALKFIKENEG